MSNEKEFVEPPDPDDPTDKEIFDEVVRDTSGYAAFERSLCEADKLDPENAAYARESADHLRNLLTLLNDDDPAANLKQRERETLHQAQVLATHSADELFACIADQGSPVVKGDALDALSALIQAAFYVGRCSTAAQEALVRAASAQRTDTGRLGAEASAEKRQGKAECRRQWILTVAIELVGNSPKRFSRESLAAAIDGMDWPSDVDKMQFSTILDDIHRLVKTGKLSLKDPMPH